MRSMIGQPCACRLYGAWCICISRESYDEDVPESQEPSLPWDIIGFHSSDLGQERWRFVLHCREIEYGWESPWPTIEPAS